MSEMVIQLALKLEAWEREWEDLPPIKPGRLYWLAERLIEDVQVTQERL